MADILKLLPKTVPHAKNHADLAAYLHEIADDIAQGTYPDLERVVCLLHQPGSNPGIKVRTIGMRDLTYLELVGLLTLANRNVMDDIV